MNLKLSLKSEEIHTQGKYLRANFKEKVASRLCSRKQLKLTRID
jgi:hypothetical protein